jgi:hypothetical protein
MKINIREYRSGNQKCTIQRNWQHDPKDYRNITPRHKFKQRKSALIAVLNVTFTLGSSTMNKTILFCYRISFIKIAK